jgi:hypothetical protein
MTAMTLNGRVGLAALMLAIFVGMDAMAAAYPFKAALMPLAVGLPGAALCLYRLLLELRRARAAGSGQTDTGPIRRELQLFGWWGAFIAGIVLFGFEIATPILLYAYLRFESREPHWRALAVAVGGLAVVYGIFATLLSVQLWPGFVPPMVSDLFANP